MFDTREDLTSPRYTTTRMYDRMNEAQFFNFTSATNSDQETIMLPRKLGKFNDNIDDMPTLNDRFQKFSHVNPKATSFSNCGGSSFSNLGGRMKACKGQGLTGSEKRACAKKLKAMGWKKGQAIPNGLAISTDEVIDDTMPSDNLRTSGDSMSTGTIVAFSLGAVVIFSLAYWGISKMNKANVPA